jgi:hypothetical protein
MSAGQACAKVTLPRDLMAEIDTEITAYEKMREQLETEHMGKWVLLHQEKLVNIYDSFDAAAEDAVRQFGRGPYLIRQIGAPPVTLPASVMYPRRTHA